MMMPSQSSLLTGLVKAPVGMFTSSVRQSSFQCLLQVHPSKWVNGDNEHPGKPNHRYKRTVYECIASVNSKIEFFRDGNYCQRTDQTNNKKNQAYTVAMQRYVQVYSTLSLSYSLCCILSNNVRLLTLTTGLTIHPPPSDQSNKSRQNI